MVISVIFLAHIFFTTFVFYKKAKEESVGIAIVNVLFIVLLFAVGWPISTFVIQLVIEPEGFGKFFDRDTISLSILTAVEFFFYRSYYGELFTKTSEVGKGK